MLFVGFKIKLCVMKNKLTLRLDSALIKRAKKHARKKGTSVSRIVANYFSVLEEENHPSEEPSPITNLLIGILKDSDIEEKDYKSYLEEKYL